MAEENLTGQTPDGANGTDANPGTVEEMSWENVEAYQPVSTGTADEATVFSTRTETAEAVGTTSAAAAPGAPERQPVPTYMPSQACGTAPTAAAPGGPGAPTGGSPYAAAPDYSYGAPAPQAQQPSSGKAVGALVCGILAILTSETVIGGIILGIVALVLAGQVVRAGGKDGKTTGAKVCGVIGIVFSVLSLIAYLIFFAIGIAMLADYDYDYNYNSYSSSGSAATPYGSDSSSSSDGPMAITEDDQAALDMSVMTLETLAGDEEAMSYVADKAATCFQHFSDGEFSLEDVGMEPLALAQWMASTVVVDPSSAISLADEDAGTATVFLDLECTDMVEYTDEILELLSSDPTAIEDADLDQFIQLIGSAAQEAMSTADIDEDCSVAFDLVKQDGTWVVDRDSLLAALDLMFCLNNF